MNHGDGSIGRTRLKRIARLAEKKIRREDDALLFEGPRLVGEAVATGHAELLLVRDEAVGARWSELTDLPIHVVGADGLKVVTDVRTPQEVVAVGRRLEFHGLAELLAGHEDTVFLDGVQDPGNVGTLARTAAGLGVDHLILGAGTADPEGPKVLRSSAGALLRLRLARATGEDLLAALESTRHRLVVPTLGGGEDLRGVSRPSPFVLVMGNEGQGSRLGDDRVTRLEIPMMGGVESLNVGAALAAILGRWL